MRGLKDARKGFLPSGILELPATSDQKAKIVDFLVKEGDAQMKYGYLNKLVNSETYNCGGILYDALQNAGLGVPQLPRWKWLPGQMFRLANDSIPSSRIVGKGEKWWHDIVLPNWSLRSIPLPKNWRNNSLNLNSFLRNQLTQKVKSKIQYISIPSINKYPLVFTSTNP